MKFSSSIMLVLFLALLAGLARSANAPTTQQTQRAMESVFRREGRGDMSGSQAFDDIGKMQVATIAATVAEMKQMNRQIPEAEDYLVPERMRGLLTTLKHQLRDIIIARVKASESAGQKPAQLRADVLATLAGYNVAVGEPEAWKNESDKDNPIIYGYVLDLEIERPRLHPDLLVATTTLALPYGNDTSLYVFKRKPGGYELAFALEANGYETILGAQSAFAYSISPPDASGSFFVVAADVNPWPTSRWQGLRYKVMRLGASPYEPQFMLRAEHGVLIDRDPIFELTTTADGFKLTFWEEQHLDDGIMVREYVLNYMLQGDRVKRVAPLAVKPEDFLDEWIHLPWSEAAEWVEPSARDEMQNWHERLHADNPSCCSELDEVCACQPQPRTWQVVVSFADKLADKLPPQVFVKIARKRDAYFIEKIGTSKDEKCAGKNLLDR
jgi:hypothetical protein